MGSDVTIDRAAMTATVGGETFGVYAVAHRPGELLVFRGPRPGGVYLGQIERDGTVAVNEHSAKGLAPAARAVCRLIAAAWFADGSSRADAPQKGRE